VNTAAAAVIDDAPSQEPSGVGTSSSPDPRWARSALIGLLVATAAFWTVGLSRNGFANSFYAAAAQAGTQSWKAFLFGSSDAGNSITVDKPPASLWPMEIAGRIFGVNSWSILVPQVLLGLASVALLYMIVKKQFGPGAGLIAGLVLAVTPVATLMFRYNNPDALLTFLMIAAVWALMRAIGDGRTRWLVLCGALIGLGFLTKQLQVMLVVPGLALTYLIAGPAKLWARIGQLLAALIAIVLAAGWWVLLVTLVPAADRPYIGGSADNSFMNLTFGYNGLSRLTGAGLPGHGGRPPMGGQEGGPPMFGGGGVFGSRSGAGRLFSGEAGAQISWLIPAALVFLIVGIMLCGRVTRTDSRRAQLLVWGGWLVGAGAVFSFMSGIFHDYYTVALAPAVAALTGIGFVQLWGRRQSRWVGLLLAGTVGATAVWSWILLGRTPDFVPPLRWFVLIGGVAAALALAAAFNWPPGTLRRTLSACGVAAAAVAVLAGPVAYAVQTVATAHNGGIISGGPAINGAAGGFPGTATASGEAPGDGQGGFPGMRTIAVGDQMKQLLSADSRAYTWVAATNGALGAASYQLATGDPVMPIGGFMSFDPAPTLQQFQRDVADHRIHYYIEGGMGPGGAGNADGPGGVGMDQTNGKPREASKIADWVKQTFSATKVDGVTLYDLTTPPH
jgi:4-amino-4-deoxy-L-arabinose transferase-like glycosyltransferase